VITKSVEEQEILPPEGVIAADDCQHLRIGDKACDFRLLDQNGEVWSLYEHHGDVIMLDFSAYWCYPCQDAGQYTQALHDDYVDQGVQVVTVLIDGANPGTEPTETEIDTWVASHRITSAPVLQGSRDKMLDGEGLAGYVLGAFPTYVYIGRDMTFYKAHVGYDDGYARQSIEEGL